jgi:hypothetical protein
VHPLQTAELGERAQQPAQLGVLVDVALAEEDAALGIEARGQQQRGEVIQAAPQLGGLIRDRGGVQIDDAEQSFAALLSLDVLADRPDVVAEVLAAGWLDPGEDAHSQDPNRGRRGAIRQSAIQRRGGRS